MEEWKLQAGAGTAEIRFAQEDFPLKAFSGQHDRIYARVLMLKSDRSAALLSVELTSLPSEAVRRFRQECSRATGVPEENVFVSVTHTFSAPHIPPHIRNEQEQQLSDVLYDRILEAIRQASGEAKKNLSEAEAEYCQTPSSLNVNRNVATPEGYWIGRDEEAYSDHTVRVLRFRQAGKAAIYLINYDIQASVMDRSESASGGRLISGDLAGAACRELEKENGVTAIFIPGCAGDQAPIIAAVQTDAAGTVTDLHEEGFVLADRLGTYLAERVRRAKRVPLAEASAPGAAKGLQLAVVTANLPEQEMKYPTKELRPHREFSFDLTGRNVEVPIALLHLGEAGLLMTAPELNSSFGTRIRQVLGERLLIGTLVNGAVKYLPEAEDFEHITYEAMNTTLGPGSAERFLGAAAELKERGRKI